MWYKCFKCLCDTGNEIIKKLDDYEESTSTKPSINIVVHADHVDREEGERKNMQEDIISLQQAVIMNQQLIRYIIRNDLNTFKRSDKLESPVHQKIRKALSIEPFKFDLVLDTSTLDTDNNIQLNVIPNGKNT